MNGLTPNCIDDFYFSNPSERETLELILSRKLPFPFGGKNGILLHGTWGTGKSTLYKLLPRLIEMAHSGAWNMNNGVGQMPAANDEDVHSQIFHCGGGLSTTSITNDINAGNKVSPIWHYSSQHFYLFDEVDKLTTGAQQSLKSVMGLKGCMFFFTTNYLNKVDVGVINRCHLVEMNQATSPSSYIPLAQSILCGMGLSAAAIPTSTLLAHATKAKGSLRTFTNAVAMDGIKAGGVLVN